MQEMITAITDALERGSAIDTLHTSLDTTTFLWKPNYPIALVDAKARIVDAEALSLFEQHHLFDTMDKTPSTPSHKQLATIARIGSAYLQSVSLMALNSEPKHPLHFQTKRQNDYWKKIQDVAHIKSMIEISQWGADVDVCAVEFSLREIIRKRKEVHALKDVGFVCIAATNSDVSTVFEHYFHEHHTSVKTTKQTYYVGWSSTLRAISMRSFVCPPQ